MQPQAETEGGAGPVVVPVACAPEVELVAGQQREGLGLAGNLGRVRPGDLADHGDEAAGLEAGQIEAAGVAEAEEAGGLPVLVGVAIVVQRIGEDLKPDRPALLAPVDDQPAPLHGPPPVTLEILTDLAGAGGGIDPGKVEGIVSRTAYEYEQEREKSQESAALGCNHLRLPHRFTPS